MADHADEIAEIDAILNGGASKVSFDGTSVDYDFDELRKRRRELQAADDGSRGKRPVAARINLSGF